MLLIEQLFRQALWVLSFWPWALLGALAIALARWAHARGWRLAWNDARHGASLAALMASPKSARGAFFRRALARRLALLMKAPGSLLFFCRPVRLCAVRSCCMAGFLFVVGLAFPLLHHVDRWVVMPLNQGYAGQVPCELVRANAAARRSARALDSGAPAESFSLTSLSLTPLPASVTWARPVGQTRLALSGSTFDMAVENAQEHLELLGRGSQPRLALSKGAVSRELPPDAARPTCDFNPDAFLAASREAEVISWSSKAAWSAYVAPWSRSFGSLQGSALAGFGSPSKTSSPEAVDAARRQARAWVETQGPQSLRDALPEALWLSLGFGIYLLLIGAGEIVAHSRGFSLAGTDRERALFEKALLEDEQRRGPLASRLPHAKRHRL
jgi:hypothetical protein